MQVTAVQNLYGSALTEKMVSDAARGDFPKLFDFFCSIDAEHTSDVVQAHSQIPPHTANSNLAQKETRAERDCAELCMSDLLRVLIAAPLHTVI